VVAKAQQCFTAIVLALEAETIQGQTAKKIAELAKTLATMPGASVDGDAVLAGLSEDGRGRFGVISRDEIRRVGLFSVV